MKKTSQYKFPEYTSLTLEEIPTDNATNIKIINSFLKNSTPEKLTGSLYLEGDGGEIETIVNSLPDLLQLVTKEIVINSFEFNSAKSLSCIFSNAIKAEKLTLRHCTIKINPDMFQSFRIYAFHSYNLQEINLYWSARFNHISNSNDYFRKEHIEILLKRINETNMINKLKNIITKESWYPKNMMKSIIYELGLDLTAQTFEKY